MLVTRTQEQASKLREALLEVGADVVSIPVIEILPPASWAELDGVLPGVEAFDWVVLTSANAAESVAERRRVLGLGGAFPRVAAVGSSTAMRAQGLGLVGGEVLVPERAVAESLAEALVPRVRALMEEQGRVRVLLPRAERAREVLPEALRAAGAEVVVATAYRKRVPAAAVAALREMFAERARWPAVVPFTSSSSVTGLLEALREAGVTMPGEVRCVSIGEITSATMRECGVRVDGEAEVASVAGLVEAVVRVLGV